MDTALTGQILASACAFDPGTLNEAVRHQGRDNWTVLAPAPDLDAWDTGGDCVMLVADIPGVGGYWVGTTGVGTEV
ncbi:hypothetical protein [Deinococcus radiopugnans]|nr:hypothetical protein [Deinococcus radiopugnans]